MSKKGKFFLMGSYLQLIFTGLMFAQTQGGFVPNQVIIEFVENTPAEVRDQIIGSAGPVNTRRRTFATTLHELNFPEGVDLDRIISALERNPNVRFAARNAIVELSGELIPNDPDFPMQWNMRNTGQSGGLPDADVNATDAWQVATSCSNVKIGLLDTGVETTHSDLTGNLLPGWNAVTESTDVSDTSPNGHGTAVAGILAAKGNNGNAVAGLCWQAQVLPAVWVRWVVVGEDQNGKKLFKVQGGTDSDIADSIAWLRQNGAQVANASFNNSTDIPATHSQVQQSPNILFVWSAGNASSFSSSGVDVDTAGSGTRFPCVWSDINILCVAGIDRSGVLAGFSNFGVKGVDIAAPAVNVYSTTLGNSSGLQGPNLDFPNGTGTSFAAPHLTAMAALVKKRHPSYTVQQLKDALILSGRPSPNSNSDLVGSTHTGKIAEARQALDAFGDSFDDETSTGSEFFYLGLSPTTGRWGAAEGSACDLVSKQIAGTIDRSLEVVHAGIAGTTGSEWSLAIFENNYEPGNATQTLSLQVTSPDGLSLAGRRGKIAVGAVEQLTQQVVRCGVLTLYDKITFGKSTMAGLQLNADGTATPFVFFDAPFVEFQFDNKKFSLSNKVKLTIEATYGSSSVTIDVLDSDTGTSVLTAPILQAYPSGWVLPSAATYKGAFTYYNDVNTSDTLFVSSFVSRR